MKTFIRLLLGSCALAALVAAPANAAQAPKTAKFKATPGAVHVTYLNQGNLEHSLRIEKIDGFRLDVPTKGSKDQATVDLPAGTYTIYCDIPGHRQAGMHAQLVVG